MSQALQLVMGNMICRWTDEKESIREWEGAGREIEGRITKDEERILKLKIFFTHMKIR